MRARAIRVVAPSRLHFGMLSFGVPGVRQFGGVGAMIDSPGLRLTIEPASRTQFDGPLAERVQRILDGLDTPRRDQCPCRIHIESAAPEHVGLGTGTQLTLAVVAGLRAMLDMPPLDAPALAQHARRGRRSAIGTYGFLHGGLLVEAGRLEGETLAPLVARLTIPEAWRFVLAVPRAVQGLSGDDERQAFDCLPPVPLETTAELCRELLLNLLPAVAQRRCDEAGESLFRYGHAAGLCFATRQDGPFASQEVAHLVQRIRGLGVPGAGQSSWGPTVFGLVPDEAAAGRLVDRLRAASSDAVEWLVAAPNNAGARVEALN